MVGKAKTLQTPERISGAPGVPRPHSESCYCTWYLAAPSGVRGPATPASSGFIRDVGSQVLWLRRGSLMRSSRVPVLRRVWEALLQGYVFPEPLHAWKCLIRASRWLDSLAGYRLNARMKVIAIFNFCFSREWINSIRRKSRGHYLPWQARAGTLDFSLPVNRLPTGRWASGPLPQSLPSQTPFLWAPRLPWGLQGNPLLILIFLHLKKIPSLWFLLSLPFFLDFCFTLLFIISLSFYGVSMVAFAQKSPNWF